MISKLTDFFSSSNWIFPARVAYKNQVRTEMEFSYSQTENFEMEKLSSDTGYFQKNSGDQQSNVDSNNHFILELVDKLVNHQGEMKQPLGCSCWTPSTQNRSS